MTSRILRLIKIERVFVKYGIESLFLTNTAAHNIRHLFLLSPTRWMHRRERALPRGERIRLALEELGPVFVKLGQVLSTRRDLLPDDIGDELAKLQDRVPPFASHEARNVIEHALSGSIKELFAEFEDIPIASASVAQVHGARLHEGHDVVVKVLRPNIADVIDRDIGLMYLLADIAEKVLSDGKRLRPREVVAEYDRTIHDELDLVREATNAVVLRNNFKDSKTLYVPEIYWDYTRTRVLVMERIDGIPIRDISEMQRIGMNMQKLAEHGVEIFYTQVFKHNFFHADMHPGNIFVSRDNPDYPQYIAVDFGIVGSLTDEDQTYIGENLLAFFERDYRRVAQLHVDSGWVPADTRVSEFEAAVRAVCEPIFEKPLAEISFGNVLLQLFRTARRFEMEVQPQLVLLQKTLLNIEGLGRQLYPDLDLWATGKPFLQQWVVERNHPKIIVKRFIDQAPQILRALPDMPLMVRDYLQLRTQLGREQSQPLVAMQKHRDRRYKNIQWLIVGATLTVSAALLVSASIVSAEGEISAWTWLVAVIGGVLLLRGMFDRIR